MDNQACPYKPWPSDGSEGYTHPSPEMQGQRVANTALDKGLTRPILLQQFLIRIWETLIMKAMVIDGFGGADKLHWADLPTPNPAAGEVLIKLTATSVNPVEWKIREGYLSGLFPHHFPLILGWDAAGTVAALGEGVTGFQIGQPVFAYCRKPEVQWGTYAEYVTMTADAVAPAPASIALQAAATIPLVGLTSWQALFDVAGLKAGQSVLIHAGAGGIGSLAIQLAKAKGARVLTTARAVNHDYVKSLGADIAIDYSTEDFAAAVRRAEPDGVDVVYDAVGGDTQAASWAVLKKGGFLVSITDAPDADKAKALGVRAAFHFVSPNGAQLRDIAALIDQGAVKAPVFKTMPLDQAAQAHAESESHRVQGKIVLTIG